MERRIINAPDAPSPSGGGAEAVHLVGASQWLLVSGQVPLDAENRVPNGFAAQARQAWANLDAQLRAAGMTRRDLQKVTIYLADRSYGDENRAARTAYLGDHSCAVTVVIAGIFDPAWLLEIEAVAAQ